LYIIAAKSAATTPVFFHAIIIEDPCLSVATKDPDVFGSMKLFICLFLSIEIVIEHIITSTTKMGE
jgi:hypothetical protein